MFYAFRNGPANSDFLGFKGVFAQFMTMWEKKILARAVEIQEGIGDNHAFFIVKFLY